MFWIEFFRKQIIEHFIELNFYPKFLIEYYTIETSGNWSYVIQLKNPNILDLPNKTWPRALCKFQRYYNILFLPKAKLFCL